MLLNYIPYLALLICKLKGKVVPVLFLTKHYAKKVYWGVEL